MRNFIVTPKVQLLDRAGLLQRNHKKQAQKELSFLARRRETTSTKTGAVQPPDEFDNAVIKAKALRAGFLQVDGHN